MKASVAIFAYNHAGFIGHAIESVLAQETEFDFEIVIGEDCSTDETRNVVREYHKRHPNRIRLLLNKRNLGAIANFRRTIEGCRGQYVATLDGDDYWTYPGKLQRQVGFLDAHPDYAVCFHNALMVWEDGTREPVIHRPPGQKATYTVEELLTHNFITTASAVVRRACQPALPEWWASVPVFDWPFFVLHALGGRVGYINECWSAYRQHGQGVYSAMSLERQMAQNIDVIRIFRGVLGPDYEALLTRALSSRYLTLALHCRAKGNAKEAERWALMSIRESDSGWRSRWRARLKILAYMNVPGLYRYIASRRAASWE
jgi:glycosyltransferase involved in cell wall biosynthesis